MDRPQRQKVDLLLRWVPWVLALFLLGATARDFHRNWQGPEIASHPDEAAHFVTGMMARDYLLHHWGEHPIRFAEQYYARYPKVALGHWPPGYYAMQAIWLAFFGASVWWAHAWNWVLAIGFLVAWTWGLRKGFGLELALGSGAALLALPVLHRCAELVLSDWAPVLWSWLAAMCWVQGRSAWLWVGLASLAILSKGNAWMLLPALLLAPWLSGEGKRMPWRGVIWICLLSAPFYLWAKSSGFSYPLRNVTQVNLWQALPRRWGLMANLWAAMPLALWLLAAAGVVLGAWKAQGEARRWWAFSTCLSGATLVFLCVSGLSFEDRAVAVALPFLMVLVLQPVLLWPRGAALALLVLFCLLRSPVMVGAVKGFRGMAAALPDAARSVLIVSDSVGEGALIAHVLEGDVRREKVVVRGSKLLSEQDWNARHQTMRFQRAEEIAAALQAIPVQYVLLDSQNQLPYAVVLREMSAQWQLIERRRVAQRVLELYALPENLGQALRPFAVPLGPERGGREILLKPGPL